MQTAPSIAQAEPMSRPNLQKLGAWLYFLDTPMLSLDTIAGANTLADEVERRLQASPPDDLHVRTLVQAYVAALRAVVGVTLGHRAAISSSCLTGAGTGRPIT